MLSWFWTFSFRGVQNLQVAVQTQTDHRKLILELDFCTLVSLIDGALQKTFSLLYRPKVAILHYVYQHTGSNSSSQKTE